MKTNSTFGLLAGLALTIASSSGFAVPQPDANQGAPAPAGTAAQAPQSNAKQGDYEELTQGPVHEAFAEPVVFDAEPGIIVPNEPPAPIKEIQPKEKPEGADVVWVGGYWGWDATKKDFLWVSGIWRVQPADRQWKPGYWNKVDGGYQWISGFWEPTGQDAEPVKTKLPKPPKSLEKGPSSPQPDDQHVWIPGNWDYNGSDYAWSPGYWAPGYDDRVYVPSRYVYYPDGYSYVGGYWDYPVANRGFLFAPVYFPTPVYASVGFSFTPGLVISTGFFLDNIFAYPTYGHYYFGNYYDSAYVGFGIYPAYSPLFLAIGFSDIWEHDCWDNDHHHHDDWDHHKYHNYNEYYQSQRMARFDHLRDNAGERPGRTFQENAARMAGAKAGERGALAGRPFKDVLADKKFVGEFAKQSRQSVLSARQATIAERKNVRTEVKQDVLQQKNASRVDQLTHETDRKNARTEIQQNAIQQKNASRVNQLTHETDRNNVRTAEQQKATDEKNASHSDSAVRESIISHQVNVPNKEKALEHKQPVQDTDKTEHKQSIQTDEKSDADKTPPQDESNHSAAVKGDNAKDTAIDRPDHTNNRANAPTSVRQNVINDSGHDVKHSDHSSQNQHSNDDKKSGNKQHDN